MANEKETDATNVKVSKDQKTWEVTVSASLPPESLATHRSAALKRLTKEAELPGFRKGAAPADLVLKKVGEAALLRDAAERAVRDEIPKLFAQHQLIVIAPPAVSIATPAAGSPLSFTATAPLLPSVELPDYANISKKHPAPEGPWSATDDELKDALTHLRRERMRIEAVNGGMAPEEAAEEAKKADTLALPPLDDAFAVSVGFKDAGEFEESVKKNIALEKERAAVEKRRAELIDAIVSYAKVSMPGIVREWELDEMEAQFKDDISRMGATWEGYLSYAKKTREDLRETWLETAEKRAKTRLVLDAIAAKEGLEPSPETIEEETAHLKQHYPQASEENLRAYTTRSLRTSRTLYFLETGSKDMPKPEEHEHDHHEHDE